MTPKKIFLLTFVIVIGSIFMVSCSRGEGVKPEQEMIGKKEVCPVTGETFTITRHTPVVEHDGNTYYFCCPGCDKSFKENPERYIAQSDATAMRSAEPDTLDFGTQAVCPVTGDTFTIAKHTPAVSYNGKLYYFCCPGCDTEFMKEPEKFLHGGNNDHHSNTVPQSSDDIAYWTCSMHPEVRSDTEGNCPICGMALIPKHELSGSSNSLLLNDTEIELAGIRVEPARKQSVIRIIELVGSVAYDPELVIAQEEYLTARSMLSALDGADKVTLGRTQQVIDKARYKLRLLGMDDAEILYLARTGRVTSSLVIPDGEAWVYADAYEADIPWIRKKQQVRVAAQAFPGEEFEGVVTSVNPTLNTMTRAVRVRIRLKQGSGKLKPGMYVSVKIQAVYTSGHAENDMIAVPRSAVINTGKRTVVWVYKGEGAFEPRLVQVGPAGTVENGEQETRVYPILAGLDENDLIVVNGNFLIDSESQITGIAAIGYGGALEVDEQ